MSYFILFFSVKLHVLFVLMCLIYRPSTCKSITVECSREVTNYCYISFTSIDLPEENTFYVINTNRYWRPIETILEIRPENRSYISSLVSIYEQFPDLERLYISNSLNDVPSMKIAPRTLQFISFRHNFITILTKLTFDGAPHLEQIDLSENSIRSIESGTFNGLDRLISIRLNNNKLGSLHQQTFVGTKSLQYINLRNNSISTIADGCFALENLEELILAENHMEMISNSIFDGATRLKKVFFAHNRIKVINLIAVTNSAPIEIFSFEDNELGKYEKQSINCTSELNNHLKELNLAKNKLESIKIFDSLKCLQNLEMLNLNSNNFVRFENVSDLRIYFPYLYIIHLIDNKIKCDWLNQTAFDTSLFFTRSIRAKFTVNNIVCIP